MIGNPKVRNFFKMPIESAKNLNTSKYRRTILALAAVGLLLILSGCGKNGAEKVQGNLLFLRGSVTFDSGKESTHHPQPLTIGSTISVGNRLQTSPDAMAALSLIPGIFIQAGEETEIVIEKLRVQKRGDAMVNAMKSRLAAFHLNRGVIYASLPNIGSGICELKVQTDLGTLIAQRGAIVSMRLMNETVRVVCVDGEVEWNSADGGAPEKIPEGYFHDYRRYDVSSGNFKSELTSVTENAGAQNDAAIALETAAAFDEFALRVRNAPALKSSHPVNQQPIQP